MNEHCTNGEVCDSQGASATFTCVPCLDTESGSAAKDAGCGTDAEPVCDTSGAANECAVSSKVLKVLLAGIATLGCCCSSDARQPIC